MEVNGSSFFQVFNTYRLLICNFAFKINEHWISFRPFCRSMAVNGLTNYTECSRYLYHLLNEQRMNRMCEKLIKSLAVSVNAIVNENIEWLYLDTAAPAKRRKGEKVQGHQAWARIFFFFVAQYRCTYITTLIICSSDFHAIYRGWILHLLLPIVTNATISTGAAIQLPSHYFSFACRCCCCCCLLFKADVFIAISFDSIAFGCSYSECVFLLCVSLSLP